MAVQGGFGLVLKINTGSLVAVVNVVDADFPRQSRVIAENTAHDASGGYYMGIPSGKRRLDPFRAVLNWDDAAASHAAVLTNFAAETSIGMSIQDPDGQEVIAFNAYIENIGRISRQENGYQAEVTIHPTGAPTIT
jgi:hypothetical protein